MLENSLSELSVIEEKIKGVEKRVAKVFERNGAAVKFNHVGE